MKERVSINLLMNFFITIGIGVLGFVVNKYFAEYMGIETLGLMRLFSQLIAYLNIAELGIGTASAYALYKPLNEKNFFKISKVFATIDLFYKRIAWIILIMGLFVGILIPHLIKVDLNNNKIYFYWTLYVINTSLSYSFTKYIALFTANQEYGYVRKIQGVGKILFQIFQIFVLIRYQSFEFFIIIMILENFYSIYFYKYHYKKYYNYITKTKEREKNIINDMKNLFWHNIGTLVVHNTDYIVLSKFVSLSIVGIYSSYLMVYKIVLTLINVITTVITPRIGYFVTTSSDEEKYMCWKKLQVLYTLLSTIFIICSYYLIIPFITLWLGDEFILQKKTIFLILLNLYINLLKIVTDIFKFSCGFFDDTYAPILESVINLGFSLLLVEKIGLDGVLIGTLLSNFTVIFLLKPMLVFKRCFNKKSIVYLKDMLLLLGFSIISMLLIILVVSKFNYNFIANDSWMIFIKNSLLLGILSVSICVGVFLFDKTFRILIKSKFKFDKKVG